MTAPHPPETSATVCVDGRLDALLYCWLAERACTVATKTLRADQDLLRLIPGSYLSRDPHTISSADVDGMLVAMRGRHLSEPSIRRHRASLSQFFAWCVRVGTLAESPVTTALSPAHIDPAGVRPFEQAELEAAWRQWRDRDDVLADVMLVLARTGLRWGEARVLTVGDVVDDAIIVDKTASEGVAQRHLPPSQHRHVHIAPRVRGIVRTLANERGSADLLLTTSRGAQLHRSAVMRTLDWSRTGRGRRLHDLRHTAAHLWLTEGVDAATVRSWMGPTRLAVEKQAC